MHCSTGSSRHSALANEAGRESRDSTDAALAHLDRTVRAITGAPLSSGSRAQFARYLDLLITWNRAQRLTAFDSAQGIVRGLLSDALLFLDLLPSRPISIVDLGAGAGIPGLPLRIADPAIALTLVEARRRRVSFLKTVKRELGLQGVDVFEGRAETIHPEIMAAKGQFDAVVARAVAPIGDLAPIALRYLKPGGRLIATAPPAERVLRRGDLVAGVAVEVREFP